MSYLDPRQSPMIADPAQSLRPDWRATLAPGDVVSFTFPINERGAPEAPKSRPCLVLDVFEIDGMPQALLAYGTSVKTRANTGLEIRVGHEEDIRTAGLDRPTRFVGARRVVVPLDDPGFCIGPGGSPVLGRLGDSLQSRFEQVRHWVQATPGPGWCRPMAPARSAFVVVSRRRVR